MICPKCGCEYREGFYKCSDCKVALVDENTYERMNPPAKEFIPEDLVEIHVAKDNMEADIIKDILGQEGIYCFIQGYQLQRFSSFELIQKCQYCATL